MGRGGEEGGGWGGEGWRGWKFCLCVREGIEKRGWGREYRGLGEKRVRA